MALTKKASPATKKKKQKKELSYEWQRVAHFFQFFDLEGSTENLWEMLKLALTSEEGGDEIKDRREWLYFYEYTKELFENIYALLQQKIKAASKKQS